jgi:hypothetical protein
MADKAKINRRGIGAAIGRLKWTSAPCRALPHGALGLIGLSSGALILGFVMAGSFAASRSVLLPIYLASQTGSAVAGGLMAPRSGNKYERIFRITACFQLCLLYHAWRFHEGRSPPGRLIDLAFAMGTVRLPCFSSHTDKRNSTLFAFWTAVAAAPRPVSVTCRGPRLRCSGFRRWRSKPFS